MKPKWKQTISEGGNSALLFDDGKSESHKIMKPKWKQTISEGGNSALLFDDNTVVLFHETRPKPFAIINTCIDVNNVIISSEYFGAISTDTVQIYSIQNQQCQPLTEIPMESHQSIAAFEDTLYVAQNQNLLLTDMEGSVKLKIRLGGNEGNSFLLGSNAEILVQLTDNNMLKVLNVGQKEPFILHTLSFKESLSSHLVNNVLSIKISIDGMVTSVLLDDGTLLLISNREGKMKRIGSVKNHYFCQIEAKVFVYETFKDDDLVVHICFFDEDLNLYTFEEMRLDPLNSQSIGLTTPTITVVHDLSSTETSTDKTSNQMYRIQSRKMLGFEHCDNEDADKLTTTTMFYHQLLCGHLDKALALAKQINQESIWKKLASHALCDRDTVVLKECSSPLGFEMITEEMHDELTMFGEIAVEIGMLEEAVNLYKDLDRKDLICDLYVSRRMWDQAFRAAEEEDVLRKSIHYYCGKDLEARGDLEGASAHFGKSSLPEQKLLLWRYERGIIATPQSLLEQIKDEENMSLPGLIAEYNGDLEEAQRLFRATNDVANLIRIACGGSTDNFEHKLGSIPLQKDSDFYQMGIVFENQGDLPRAVENLRKSGSLDHAIRIIKMRPEYTDLLVELALESKDSPQKISCAEIIAKKGLFQKAARLFLDVGNVSKATEIMKQISDESLLQEALSFQETVEYVNLIDELDLDIPTKSIKTCAKVLLEAKNEEKAIKFMQSRSLPVDIILALLKEYNVTLSKQKLSVLVTNDVDSIAQHLIQSGDFVGASELYSEKGDYIKGLKCLLNNGTPPTKVIEYAKKSNSKEVFILAGNYLQTINYKDEPSIKKALVTFYTNSESYLQLVSLFMMFSEEEALSTGDYQKTLKLLNEASKYSRLIDTWDNLEDGRILANKINSTTKFLEAKRLFSQEGNVEEGKKLCLELLQSRVDPSPVQLGDIFASLIEYETDNQVSYELVNQMLKKNLLVEEFLDSDVLEHLFKANGKVWGNQSLIDEKQSFYTEEDALFHLSQEQRLINHVCRKHWQEAREAISANKEGLTVSLLNRICCECPPQSVLVEVMRSKAHLFKELDDNKRYPLHYLCKHGASAFTIIFAIQRHKDALYHKDLHGMTPVEYIKTSSWTHEDIQDEKPMLLKELREAYNLSI